MRLSFLTIVLATLPGLAHAHKPSYSEGQYNNAASAWSIQDPDVSIVLYHPVECRSQVLWLRYEVPESREIFVQLGVPKIDRLGDYEPRLAFVHSQGEEGTDLPFTPPEGYGVSPLPLDADGHHPGLSEVRPHTAAGNRRSDLQRRMCAWTPR